MPRGLSFLSRRLEQRPPPFSKGGVHPYTTFSLSSLGHDAGYAYP